MTGNCPSFTGRKTSARNTRPSSIVIGTFQLIRMPSRTSVRSSNTVMAPPPRHYFSGKLHRSARWLQARLGALAAFHLRHLFHYGADRGGVLCAEAALFRLAVDRL